MRWDYEKLDEDGKLKSVNYYTNDTDGKITGKVIINVKAYFDENPDEWKRLGWTKHLHPSAKGVEYNHQTQFLSKGTRRVDEYTVEDVYYIIDKSEEQLEFEEMLSVAQGEGNIIFYGGDFNG